MGITHTQGIWVGCSCGDDDDDDDDDGYNMVIYAITKNETATPNKNNKTTKSNEMDIQSMV